MNLPREHQHDAADSSGTARVLPDAGQSGPYHKTPPTKTERSSDLIGTSAAISEVQGEIDRIAKSSAKVLITGESGVGKELVAHAIHARSPRARRAFIAVNCAGLPETLLESELFGHVKGSFTGAYRDKPGKLEVADQGTLFLDEVGEMTLRMQGVLLRVLETGEIQKVGADRAGARVDVRVIAATNRDLRAKVAEGAFREDLFYRLNVIQLVVPPLRERREDIPLLVAHFMRRFAGGNSYAVRAISQEALELLTLYAWPGNVRELENVIERLVVTGRREEVGPDDLPHEIRAAQGRVLRPKQERRHTVVDDLFRRMTAEHQSFWTSVYPLYMQREITRQNVRDLVGKGLQETRGSYKILARMFNMDAGDYKRFLNFLRKHDCQVPYRDYRA
jgi:transcriptional regulator with GAF, ATPase, and Fis domain